MALEFLNRKVRVVQDIMLEDVPVLGTIERRGDSYSVAERIALFQKFFTKRRVRKEIAAASRLGSL